VLDFRRTFRALGLDAAVVGMLVPTSVILAQTAVAANDHKIVLVNGMGTVMQSPAPDTVAIINLRQFPPKIPVEIEVPASIVGPSFSVAIAPDESLVLVTAAMKIDLTDATNGELT
jgi:hypothetical protein